jgi:Sec-independent protein translocase protein TatA
LFQFLILLVGYFVLGPSDLYKLVKEIGKFIQNLRTLGSDLSTTFENNMESSLQLDEIRKAQRELNDAFSFRRSINVDADSEAFSVAAGSAQENMAAAAATTTTAAATASSNTETAGALATSRKIRRRVKKREAIVDDTTVPISNIPDLEMPTVTSSTTTLDNSDGSEKYTAQELAEIDADFDKYVIGDSDASSSSTQWDKMQDWYKDDSDVTNAKHNGEQGTTTTPRAGEYSANTESVAAQTRFQQQLSGNWNDQILSASDKLEPMAAVMNKIALLEQEKQAALRRLQDEFAQRTELEERYYREQRKLLEETATEIQSVAFGLDSKSSSSNAV